VAAGGEDAIWGTAVAGIVLVQSAGQLLCESESIEENINEKKWGQDGGERLRRDLNHLQERELMCSISNL
jgi:hypothetical protein